MRRESDDLGRRREQLLEVVEQEQRSPLDDGIGELGASAPSVCEIERETRSRRVAERASAPKTPCRGVVGRARPPPRSRAASFRATRAGQRDQSGPRRSERHELVQLVVAAEERRRRRGQVRPESLQRRELVVAQLVEALRPVEVLEPMLAEVTWVGAGELARSREAPPARRGRRPRSAPPCALRSRRRLGGRGAARRCAGRSGPDRPWLERLLRLSRRRRVARSAKATKKASPSVSTS